MHDCHIYVSSLMILFFSFSAPTDSPQNVTGYPINSTAISLKWTPPEEFHHNGIITSYLVNLTELETGIQFSHRFTAKLEVTISSLHPFYTYECMVSAVTVSSGPFSAPIYVTTLEDGEFILLMPLHVLKRYV